MHTHNVSWRRARGVGLAAALTGAIAAPALADINIGVSVSTTGPAAVLGIPEKNTVPLCPTSIAGQKVNYVVLDDATDPSQVTKNARKFATEDNVDLFIGSSSTPGALAMTEVAAETKTPQLTLAPTPYTEPAKDAWAFRMPQSSDLMAKAWGAHMEARGVKALGFIGYADTFGESFVN